MQSALLYARPSENGVPLKRQRSIMYWSGKCLSIAGLYRTGEKAARDEDNGNRSREGHDSKQAVNRYDGQQIQRK
jgi:hypothetical protein